MKILSLVNGRPTNVTPIITSSGATDGLKVFQTDASGKIDVSLMPTGFGADVVTILASEALTAGDFVNIYSNSGVANCRKAIATSTAFEAHGYVIASVASAGMASVYYDDNNTAASGMTPGLQFLSDVTAGKTTTTAPSATGTIAQTVGVASSATSIHVRFGESYTN